MLETYSQHSQDLIVLNFYDNKTNGFFVDIGSHDGITLSNTYLLENKYKWNGICIEAEPKLANKCFKNRKCNVINKACYSENDLMLKFCSSDLLSGLETTHLIKDKSQNFIDSSFFYNNYLGDFLVETITLTNVLDDINAPKFIEYLSIDVEGAEVEVLKGIDFSKYKFGMIHIEHNWQPYRLDILNILEKNGYYNIGENSCDDVYLHSDFIVIE